MPVNLPDDIHLIEQERFHAIDREVMAHAFDIHNTMGRFLDERIYQEELARRCRASGFTVSQEVPIRVSHRDFNKPYYLDMLVEHGVIYELKAADGMTGTHMQQLINYLILCGLRHGLLREIKERFDAEGIEIPFPHRTLYAGSVSDPFPIRLIADKDLPDNRDEPAPSTAKGSEAAG